MKIYKKVVMLVMCSSNPDYSREIDINRMSDLYKSNIKIYEE